jgi:hypothetical protein
MAYQGLTLLPGCCKVDSAYANSVKATYASTGVAVGRYVDMLNARFIAGRPEKLGGYISLIATQLTGICRGMKDWRDFSQNLYCAFGTTQKLQVYLNTSATLIDITPFRAILTNTLTNPLTTNASTTVSVAHTAHGLFTGDYVQLTAQNAVNGVQVANTYFITKTDANNYTIQTALANGSTSGAGGTVTYVYYRVTLSSSPFATVSGSNIVTITLTGHGASVGDFVQINGASAVATITLSGEYPILSTTTNTFTVMASNNANATTTGGGTPNLQFDISIGTSDTAGNSGYGNGTYGTGGYGQAQTSGSIISTPRIWSLDAYGQQLLALPYGGTIYVWDPSTYASNNGRAYPLYGAPPNALVMFITPERFILAIGTTGNYMLIQWPDQNNYNTWTATPTNTANSRTLQVGSYAVGGISARDGTSLVLTNNCCYAFNYSGDQYVYDSTAIGRNSGLIGPLAICALGGNAYWMGVSEFWMYNGTVSPLPSDDIRDYVFKNINQAQASKCFAVTNTAKKEITFYYPASPSNEITNSVTFHLDQNCWSINTKARTSQVDALLFLNPISSDPSGNIWQEEAGTDAAGAALDSYVTANPMPIMKGDKIMDVMGFLPDFERQVGSLSLSVLTSNYPDDAQAVSGPFTLLANDGLPLLDLRIGSRLVGYKVESNVIGGDYRVGLCQADAQPAGARR